MRVVNVHEAKTQLSRLIQEALDGQEVVIARDNVPVVRLVVLEGLEKPRILGSARGLVELSEDFDEPLTDFDEYR